MLDTVGMRNFRDMLPAVIIAATHAMTILETRYEGYGDSDGLLEPAARALVRVEPDERGLMTLEEVFRQSLMIVQYAREHDLTTA